MSKSVLVPKDRIRFLFARALSKMYMGEIVEYREFVDIVFASNEAFSSSWSDVNESCSLSDSLFSSFSSVMSRFSMLKKLRAFLFTPPYFFFLASCPFGFFKAFLMHLFSMYVLLAFYVHQVDLL